MDEKLRASKALEIWAFLCADGRLGGWRPSKGGSGGDADCDDECIAFRVELFFAGPDRVRFRGLALKVMLGSEPTMREVPEWSQFCSRFRAWWRLRGIAKRKGFEEA